MLEWASNECDTKRRTVIKRKWILLSTRDRRWQLMEDVNGMWYTMNEWYRAFGALKRALEKLYTIELLERYRAFWS